MIFVLIGVFAGVLGGMGLGGGSVLIPLLSILGVAQKSAQVINVFSFVIMAVIVVGFNIKNKLINLFPATIFALFALIFAVTFALVVKDANSQALKVIFGVFLIVFAIVETFKFATKYYSKNK